MKYTSDMSATVVYLLVATKSVSSKTVHYDWTSAKQIFPCNKGAFTSTFFLYHRFQHFVTPLAKTSSFQNLSLQKDEATSEQSNHRKYFVHLLPLNKRAHFGQFNILFVHTYHCSSFIFVYIYVCILYASSVLLLCVFTFMHECACVYELYKLESEGNRVRERETERKRGSLDLHSFLKRPKVTSTSLTFHR